MSLFPWIAAALALVLSQPQTRLAKHYSPNVMQHVVEVRLAQGLITEGDLRGVVGYYSMPSCSGIGSTRLVSLYDPVRRAWMKPARMLQTDCSQTKDRARHEREALIEVDWDTARAAHMTGEGRTTARVWEVEKR